MSYPHAKKKSFQKKAETSWQPVEKWYKKSVGLKGQYYHEHVIIPGALHLLALEKNSSLLDLACGQGVLARHLDPQTYYQGFDLSPSLIQFAKKNSRTPHHHFDVGDITKKLPIQKFDFSHAALLLSIQNIEHPNFVFKNARDHLAPGGKLVVTLNHPCFRIPKNSSWEIDEENKIQYRRINRYLSSFKVPIQMNPSQEERSAMTWSFHHSLSYYSKSLYENGFVILKIEEWISDKKSEGKKAAMENQSRKEIPLFLTILAKKA